MGDDKDKDNLQFQAFDASPGEKYRQWRQNLYSYAATKTDESGSSLADTLRGIDMGGPGAGAPAIPPGAPGLKMARLRDARAKAAYALIYKHISDGDLRTILFTNHFQDGFATIQFLDMAYDTPITRSELREMDKLWTELSIAQDVGIQQDSVSRFAKLLQRVNAERPAGQRHGLTEMTEKLLEAIADASRHFNEGAMREYDAPAGARQFEYPAGHPAFPGQRNFGACVQYYDGQWKQAVKSKILTVTAPLRRAGGQPARAAADVANRALHSHAGEHRASSPSRTLQALAATGLDISSDTATTTDFHALAAPELANAVGDNSEQDDFALEQCYDADGVPSVEIICDNCRGVGHPRRLCPSPRKYRTFDFAISLLQSAKNRAETRAQHDGRPRGGRRPPPRGQRAPFRPRSAPPTQPRNFSTQTRHQGHQAVDTNECASQPPPDNAHHAQPTTFADDDYFDPVFAHEGEAGEPAGVAAARLAVPEPPTSVFRRLIALLLMVVHSFSLRAALVVGSVAVVAHAVAAPVPCEHLGMLIGRTSLPGVVACVDSGATVTCLAESLAFSGDVDFTVTKCNPRRKLRVASDQTLDIVAIGELRFNGVHGYRVVNSQRVAGTANVIFHEVAVVRGLSQTTILLSVKSMKQHDGIRVYFNDDNADRVDDCVKLACGLYVPFLDRSHDLPVPVPVPQATTVAHHLLCDTPWDVGLRIHAALCHPGATRVQRSNITYSGRTLPPMPMPHLCVGCRLGGGKAAPSATGRKRDDSNRPSREQLNHYGQLVYSDCCTGFPPSFPHGFTGMVNFCDGYSGDRDRRFLTRVNSTQVHGALADYCRVHRSQLQDGKIGCWQTDNGKEFRGECLTDAVDDLIEHHDFTVPNNRNANAVAERDWGVIERGVRACLAYADAPACLWPWAAQQCSHVYHFLATTVHTPPRSAHEFLHPGCSAVDMTWARVLFCDVTVALPERDVHGKLWHRAADGCHLGYDAKRRAHVVYCPRYRRLGTFTVTDWCGERNFTICKLISADTPVEYHQVDDLPMAPATATLLPSHFRAGREPGALAGSAREQAVLKRSLSDTVDDLAQLAGTVDSCLTSEAPNTIGCDVECSAGSASATQPALPTTIEEARRSPYWPMVKEALESEIKGKFVDNQAWDVVPRTAGMHVIRSKWVLKWALNPDGTVKSVKARLVACGYGQIKGREFTDVYARTLAAPSFRLFCSIVALENLETDHIDAYKAFTQSYVDCDIYVEMPLGFSRAGYVLKLRKALEGIRQGAHLWMEHNKAVLVKLGFRQSLVEASLYVHGQLDIVIAVFADDIAAAYSAAAVSEYTAIKAEYAASIRVRTEAIVSLAVFTGVVIDRNRDLGTLTIHQKPYLDQLAERYKGQFTLRNTPGPTAYAARREFDKMVVGQPSDKDLVDRVEYLKLIGALVWPASMTRPDVAYYVSFLASFSHCPRQVHRDAALNVLGYLVQTREMGITYGGPLKTPPGLKEMPPGFVESGGLHTYHDSSWGTSAKPYGGFVVMRGNGTILASSRALKIVPDSTAEAETAVASKAAKETTAVRAICEDLGRVVRGPTVLLGDNKASYDIIVKTGLTARTRYFERATLLVKRLYMLLAITPYLITTNEMVADILTKCADKVLFYKMRAYMLNARPPAESLVQKIAGRFLAWA